MIPSDVVTVFEPLIVVKQKGTWARPVSDATHTNFGGVDV